MKSVIDIVCEVRHVISGLCHHGIIHSWWSTFALITSRPLTVGKTNLYLIKHDSASCWICDKPAE